MATPAAIAKFEVDPYIFCVALCSVCELSQNNLVNINFNT